jgi:class 3 adenylate cyclase
VGFTTFSERFGEEAAFALVREMTGVIGEVARAEGSDIHNVVGDGVIVVFGAPIADEDAPLRACRTALASLAKLESVWSAIGSRYGVRPAARMGISAGSAVFGSVHGESAPGPTVLGDAVNVASRLQALAEPGMILINDAARRLVEGRVDLDFIGERVVKGRQAAERVYRLTGLREGATRFEAALDRGLTVFTGRADELDGLIADFEAATAGARVIDVVGEPGIGKSRLLHEFRLRLQGLRTIALSGICTPEAREKPFHAFIDVGRGAFRITPDDDRAAVEGKLQEGLEALGLATDEAVDLLLNLLGFEPTRGRIQTLDGVLIGLRTRELLGRVVRARARLSPLVLLIDDLHWIDSASLSLIEQLADTGAPARLLIVHSRRPGPPPSWAERPATRILALSPLGPRETSNLIRARFAEVKAPDPLVSKIAEKADGNPLFAEEIVSYLVEQGLGASVDPQAVAAATPETVQAIFASRVDRLPPRSVRLLQIAAVIGRRFDPRLVATIAGAADWAADALAELGEQDLVRADDATGEYEFKHALLRDTIYDRLLSAPRAEIHAAVAQEMERRGGNSLLERAEQLAHHFAEADIPAKAFHYLALAARKSLNVYVIPEAEAQFRKALAVLERHPQAASPQAAAGVVAGLLETLMLKSEYAEAGKIAEAYMPLVRSAGDTRELVVASYYLTLSLVQQYRLLEGRALAQEALEVAKRLGDERARAFACVSLMHCRTRLGLDGEDEAQRRRAELIADAQRLNDNFLRNSAYFVVCWDCIYRGLMKEARAYALQLNAAGEANGDPRAIGFANWMLGWVHVVGGSPEHATAYARDSARFSIAPFDQLQARTILAVSAVLSGNAREGLQQMLTLNAEFRRLGALYSALEGPLGVALIGVGRLREGIVTMERAIAARDAVGDRSASGWTRLLLAEVYIEILAGGRRAPWRVILANLFTLLAIRLTGARRASALLAEAARHSQWSPQGSAIARIEYDRGRLHEMRGRRREALQCFRRACDLFGSQGLETPRKLSEAALARVA